MACYFLFEDYISAMPELPEVETVARGLSPAMVGRHVVNVTHNREDLRFPFPSDMAQRIEGQAITSISRRAKYLLFHLSSGDVVLAHLGMSGKMLINPLDEYEAQKHDHVLWELDDGNLFIFNDARRFGMIDIVSKSDISDHQLLSSLGPEPLSDSFDASYLAEQLKKRSCDVKVALMDQKLVVGVGNIYACEALFMSGVSPFMEAKKAVKHADALVANIKTVLSAAIDSGGSTLRDYVRSDGDIGYFQHKFSVYGHENSPCFVCETPIIRQVQAGRSTFFCPTCQKVSRHSLAKRKSA